MSPWNDAALACLKKELKLNVSLNSGLGDRLERAAGGFMDRHEAQRVTQKPSNNEQMEEVVECLRRKCDDDFYIFLELLRETNNGGWAEALKVAAERKEKVLYMHIYRGSKHSGHIHRANWEVVLACILIFSCMPTCTDTVIIASQSWSHIRVGW